MKLNLIRRMSLALVLLIVSFLAAPVLGPVAFALPLAAALNYAPVPFLHGTSYPQINTTQVANLTTDTDKAREELWTRRVLLGSEALYQEAPLSEPALSGRIVPGQKPNQATLMKAIVEMVDLQKVAGNTINVTTYAGLGGPIVVGEGNRIGSEQKVHMGSFPVTIGRGWFGVGYTAVARDETMIGGRLDKIINDGLRALHAKKRNDDHLMRMRQVVDAGGVGASNVLRPDGLGVDSLKTANTLDTVLINQAGETLPGFGALPIDTTTDSGGSVGMCYILLETHIGIVPVFNEPAYLQAQQNAGVRGDENRTFKGGFSKFNGHGLYRWYNPDHANKGPIGSPLMPRAKLGAALTGADNASVVKGGGLVYSASETPLPQYFEFFQGAFYQFYNGDTIARETGNTKYILILNSPNTGGVYSYTTIGTGATDASQITLTGRVDMSGVSGFTETHDHPQGALIVQCNALGVPIGWGAMLGAEALVCGTGSIDGAAVDARMGKRTEEHRNHDMDHAIGCEGVWGNAVVKRAGDSFYPNFLLLQHALPVPGAPQIS